MLKKIDRGKAFIAQHWELFQCPICHQKMRATDSGLLCNQGHRFDVSKKGTVYFLQRQINTDYDQQMFAPRQRMIKSGMYQPLIDQLKTLLSPQETVLDVGCGEGSFLNAVMEDRLAVSVGFDISKEGVYLATNQEVDAFWCVADLTDLPFAENSFSTLLNIFSPSNYQEFSRVLKPGGQLLKVIPGADYLRELREAFYPEDPEKQRYSNQPVLEKFKQVYPEVVQAPIRYVFEIPENRRLDLLEMSPLEWGVDPEIKAKLKEEPLSAITIDLLLLIGKNE